MQNFIIQGRAGSLVEIINDNVRIKTGVGKNEINIKKQSVDSYEIKRSIYDFPFLEKTLIIVSGGKKYKIKRLPAKKIIDIKLFI